jgi:hypothetical protein
MRVLFLPAVTAILLLADQTAWAEASRPRCVVNPGLIRNDSVALRELRVRAGQSCRLHLLPTPGWHPTVHAVDIIEPPAHGTLHTSTTTGFVTYVPAPGFIGHDQFEVIYKWTNFIQPISAVYKAEVTITP